jgi:CpeT protein
LDGAGRLRRFYEANRKGATNEQDCSSQLRGASYATSKVQISPGRIESLDQGFDSNGKQVWGATKGGYIFKKY